jgi:formyltetrahydrofolate synthetase
VPTDIEIAQEATLKPITIIAEELGLLPSEIEQYGDTKAKVKLKCLKGSKRFPTASTWMLQRSPLRLWAKAKRPRQWA